ncbi:MAG: anti-sigma F factor [Clostridia bacterium]|nr:anti-sigma F factor [Clostridia bacterium]
MREIRNAARVKFCAISENEAFARVVTAGFLMKMNVTAEELADLKTMVSEAVTNAIVHGYRGRDGAKCIVTLELKYYSDGLLQVTVADRGCGIPDVEAAMTPFFTTDKEGERSGMGLPIMQAFSDSLRIATSPRGTRVVMKKKLS